MNTSSNNVPTDAESTYEPDAYEADELDDMTDEEFEELYDVDLDELTAPVSVEEFLAKGGYMFNPADYPSDDAMLAHMEKLMGEFIHRGKSR
jgi:hypothetical protein